MTQEQRNAVIRLIQAAEIVVEDFDRSCLTHTATAVKAMAVEIKELRKPENAKSMDIES